MAILEDDDKQTTKGGRKQQEFKPIDINDTSLVEGAEQEINPDADAWDSPAPPPDGVYKCKVFLAKSAFEQGMLDDESLPNNQRVFYRCNLSLKIMDEGKWKDQNIFYTVSTYISGGREISTILGLIRKTGVEIKDKKTNPLLQCKLLRKVLQKEPALYFKGEWRAWDMGKDENIKAGMKNFPKTEDGKGHSHVVRDSTGKQISAKFKIDKVYGLKEWREQLERSGKVKGEKASSVAVSGGGGGGGGGGKGKGDEGNFQPVTNTTTVTDESDFVIDE